MKHLKRVLAFAVVVMLLLALCAEAFADNSITGRVEGGARGTVELIAGGLTALFLMRWITKKIKGDKKDIDKNRK